MYTTTVRIPEELSEAVKLYCLRTGATVNGAVVVALERLVGGGPVSSAVGASAVVPAAVRPLTEAFEEPMDLWPRVRSVEVRPDPKPGAKR